MAIVFRAMRHERNRPLIGRDDNMLGVRVPPHPRADVELDGSQVRLNGKGMSVCKDWRRLPALLIPKRLRTLHPPAAGSDDLSIFRYTDREFDDGAIGSGLSLEWGKKSHGTIVQAAPQSIEEFQNALAGTQQEWVPAEILEG
jgi:hypothetical protein